VEKETIMVFCDWFSPGYRAGGPIRSVENFAAFMSGRNNIMIVTSDRDHGSSTPYNNIETNVWLPYEAGIQVMYLAPAQQTKENMRRLVSHVKPAFVYINSMFSKKFALLPLMVCKKQPDIKIVLAPRGMLKASALSFKPFKKKTFLRVSKLTGLFKGVQFHATDAQEVNDIQHHFGRQVPVRLISNLPVMPDAQPAPLHKEPGTVKIIFTGRIHPIKNLHILLEVLAGVKATVHCSLVGILEDEAYWQKCKKIIEGLPANIQVSGPQEMAHAGLNALTRQYHLFALPTQGENFGHAIFEALCCGRPVLISDQTPWKNLSAAKAGWDLPLSATAAFTQTIEAVAAMSETEWNQWCQGALQRAQDFYNDGNRKEEYYSLFSTAE
jgi:glycosyltransferase involved in cell wall biosynthesis